MTADELKKKSKEEVLNFIRERLRFESEVISSLRDIDYEKLKNQHKRFEMSGYESQTGKCTTWNLSVLNEFADLGIYDYTSYLFLDFYKGTPTIYLKYFHENENIEIDDLSGLGTTEIIYRVFELTIFSNKGTRRRN
jgi:hypothetical protein